MTPHLSRRIFLLGLGATAVASYPIKAIQLPRQIPVNDLDITVGSQESAIRFGYAAITWDGNDAQAIKEISELGFHGIQLRSNVLKEFEQKPQALKDLLEQNKLSMVALSSGGVRIAAGTETDEIAKHVRNAKFVRAVGGRYLQVTDSARPKDRTPAASDFKQLGHTLTEIAKRSIDLGIPVGYHNHMGTLGESPEEVARIMDACDPTYVKLELDIAHYQQGGGDPARAIRQYRDRLLFLHIKDVESLATRDERGRAYRFVELGRGKVDLAAVFAMLKEVQFDGWAVVELDSVPDKSRTPKECAAISKKYLEEKLGLRI